MGLFRPFGSRPSHSKDDSATSTRRQDAAKSGGATPGGRGLLLLFVFWCVPRRAGPDAIDEARRSLSRRQDGFDPRRMCRQQVSHPRKHEPMRQNHGVRRARPARHQGLRSRKGASTGLYFLFPPLHVLRFYWISWCKIQHVHSIITDNIIERVQSLL